ncbi:MAG: LpqB family beta-propeller domain-containing protein [bacterium]|nr:LpqB family beta-propeller domain-containing protein [bacterium]
MLRLLFLLVVGVFLASMMSVMVVRFIGRTLPPGDQITYVSKPQSTVWELLVLDLDRRVFYNLTGGLLPRAVRNRLPAWSPDGRRLAFVTELRRSQEIFILEMTFASLTRLSSPEVDARFPVWAPGAISRLAHMQHNGHDWDIVVRRMDVDDVWLASEGGDPSTVVIGGRAEERHPVWSPDGTRLAFVSNRDGVDDLYMVNVDGRGLRRLTLAMAVQDYIAWSPDGRLIAFNVDAGGNTEIFAVEVPEPNAEQDYAPVRNLTRSPGSDLAPAWSPDGRWLAFTSGRDGDDEIYLMDMTTEAVQQITFNHYPDYDPVWSPDGTRLIFIALPEFTTELFSIQPDGEGLQRLTFNLLDDWSPVWRPAPAED